MSLTIVSPLRDRILQWATLDLSFEVNGYSLAKVRISKELRSQQFLR